MLSGGAEGEATQFLRCLRIAQMAEGMAGTALDLYQLPLGVLEEVEAVVVLDKDPVVIANAQAREAIRREHEQMRRATVPGR